MGTTSPLLDWALHLAARGWHLFPLASHAKRPAIKDWQTRATTDTDRITRCWQRAPYNIGLATGPSGLVVLDLDTPTNGDTAADGAEELAALCQTRGVALPGTYSVTTPSGGRHLYFTSPDGVTLRNTSGTLGARIDTRAQGGYVVAPGSLLASGGYELVDDEDPAELPAWLVQALLERPAQPDSSPREIATHHRSAYAQAALDGECQRVRNAPAGQHNTVLSTAAFNLGQLIPTQLLDHTTTEHALTTAADPLATSDCACTHHEITRVIRAGLTAGGRQPRHTAQQEAA